MAFSLGEYQDIFLEEADDQIQELNRNLLEMEKNTEDEDIINNIFRAAHSLKSSAAFVGLNDLSDLAHKMENLLQSVRDKNIKINQEIINLLFKCFDHINGVIESVSNGREPDINLTPIIKEIGEVADRARTGKGAAQASADTSRDKQTRAISSPSSDIPKTSFSADEKKTLKRGLDQGNSCYEVSVFIEKDAQMKWVKAQLIVQSIKSIGEIIKTIPDGDDINDSNLENAFKLILITGEDLDSVYKACNIDQVYRIDVVKISLTQRDNKYVITYESKGSHSEPEQQSAASAPVDAPSALPKRLAVSLDDYDDDDKKIEKKGIGKKAPALRTVKVSVDKLDELLNNVGELVIANSGFFRLYEELKRQNAEKTVINEFKNRMEQMSRIAKDLQGGIMKTRMVPIGQVFERFNRLVRDLAHDMNKNVHLVTKGEDTELDKKVIDVIGEPLMHMIRNSIDHGIETTERRAELKKPELATVTLNSYQAGNQIYVEVIDDGRGLDPDRIRRKAIERGLVTNEQAANMDSSDIYQFIFHPGFSTADTITDVSGRGVGMNVVKEVVNEMNGSISIESELGMGTRFIMAFPLTLAIIPAIMVTVNIETYAIPLSDVIETIKISENDITTIEGHEVINLRGEILSLLRLYHFVGIDSTLSDMENIPVVVVGYNNRKIGLIVDKLEGKLEIVIKSLDTNYMNVEGVAGASILGDGSICLILDISSMIAKVIYEQEKLSRDDKKSILMKREAVEKSGTEIAIETPAAPKAEAKKSELTKSFINFNAEEQTEEITKLKSSAAAPAKEPVPAKPAVESAKQQLKKEEELVARSRKISEKENSTIEIDLFANETNPVANAFSSVTADEKVQDALKNFREELHGNVSSLMGGDLDEHIKKAVGISNDELKKIQLLANVGIMNGADALSKLLGKRVDLAIPEVRLLPVEKIPTAIGQLDETYSGVYLSLSGDITGTILLSLPELSAYTLIDDLYGHATGATKELDDDAKSALKEITNIVGSSVVNAISEKTGLAILPNVPTHVHDYMQSIIDSILVLHNMKNDYALMMDTVFYYEDDRIMGNLLILPETESLKILVNNLRNE